jgi:hypothetical protein
MEGFTNFFSYLAPMNNKKMLFLLAFGLAGNILFSCSKKVNTQMQSTSIPAKAGPGTIQASLWKEASPEVYRENDTLKKQFKKYKLFILDSLSMQQLLQKTPKEKYSAIDSMKTILEIPRPDSGFTKFKFIQPR